MLVEASSFGDLTSDKYIEIQKRIDSALQSVNPNEEYRDFTDKHRFVINVNECRVGFNLHLINI